MKFSDIALLDVLFTDTDTDSKTLPAQKEKLLAFIRGSQRIDYVSNTKPTDMPQLIPHLIYDDVAGAIDWLERAFGFHERKEYRHLEADGTIGHAEMQIGNAPSDPLIMLGPPSVHGQSPRRGVSAALYLYVHNIDEHFARARAAGAQIAMDIKNQPWGDRHYQVTDPEGHQWQFAQRLVSRKD